LNCFVFRRVCLPEKRCAPFRVSGEAADSLEYLLANFVVGDVKQIIQRNNADEIGFGHIRFAEQCLRADEYLRVAGAESFNDFLLGLESLGGVGVKDERLNAEKLFQFFGNFSICLQSAQK